jgi:predicted RNase H-like HicB family nuclease
MGQKFISIRFTMHLPAVIVKKEKWYVSSCPALDVYSQGDTEEEAKKNLSEALAMFLISCHERGTLDTVLKECGFVPGYLAPGAPAMFKESDYIDVPLPFVIDMGNPNRCHA